MAKISVPPALRKLFARRGLVVFIGAAIMLEALGITQYVFARKAIRAEAGRRAESELTIARQDIEKVTDRIEVAVKNTIWMLESSMSPKADALPYLKELVNNNAEIVDAAVGYLPSYHGSQWNEPIAARRPDGSMDLIVLTDGKDDYQQAEWYVRALESGEPFWSEPYYAKSADEGMVVTYSLPVRDKSGNTVGILAADLSLEWLTELVSTIELYPNSYSTVQSAEGELLACPAETLDVSHQTVRFDTPLESTGWKLSIVLPEEEIMSGAKKIGLAIAIMQILGLILVILMIRRTAIGILDLEKVQDGKRKIENELRIASGIQMAMIPKVFPPFPERKDLDMSASLTPAKEVGGDLYDFYIRDEKLFFCVGDVSGKGVPASLVMAVTRSLFRSISSHESSPGTIMKTLNDSLSKGNESNMFVTFFLGSLDLISGKLRYCNAGHNAPLILKDSISVLPVFPNIPLGIMPGFVYKEQEVSLVWDDAIFLYTDGLTEAENNAHELFGEKRMAEVLHIRRDSESHLVAMQEAVRQFVGDAPQSDDLTMLFIHFLPDPGEKDRERRLTIHSDINEIPQLADFVKTVLQDTEADKSLTMNLNLALEEAVASVLLNAFKGQEGGMVDIEAVLRKDSLEFLISFEGKPYNPNAADGTDVALADGDPSWEGLGMFLVRKIMDSVTYSYTGGVNCLRMVKHL